MPPELGHADLERDAGAGRGLLEQQRDAACPRSALGSLAARPARLQLQRRGRAARSARRRVSSSPVRKSRAMGSRAWYDRLTRTILAPWRSASITWNLFHGRDFPPDPALFTLALAALRRATERNDTHVQVNRDLLGEFAEVLCAGALGRRPAAGMPAALGRRAGRRLQARSPQRSLTSRNWLAPSAASLARRNPDLLGSWEGGSNLTLRPGPARGRPARTGASSSCAAGPSAARWPSPGSTRGLCVANLHASTTPPARRGGAAPRRRGGGRLGRRRPADPGRRLQPAPSPDAPLFEELARAASASARPTGPDSIDHLLARGLEIVDPPTRLAARGARGALRGPAMRLSDHAPVEAPVRHRADRPSQRPRPAAE